jgi:membrane-bound serine protease (ClpP class)
VALVVALLLAFFVLDPPWELVVVVGAAMLEVGEIFVWMWYTGRRKILMGAETLIGAEAVVVSPLRPRGQVRVRGELWDARAARGADAGDRVRVVARDGLTLEVEAAPR